jgi:hypothetical protein
VCDAMFSDGAGRSIERPTTLTRTQYGHADLSNGRDIA